MATSPSPLEFDKAENVGLPGLFINPCPDEFLGLDVAICGDGPRMAVQRTEKRLFYEMSQAPRVSDIILWSTQQKPIRAM